MALLFSLGFDRNFFFM